MEDEQDPVVSRMNVFLSKRLSTNLLLLQYPVRGAGRSYDDAEVVSARVKPQQHCVDLEIAIDVKGDSHMSKMKLTSSPSGAEMSRYAIGVVNNGELHLTPLNDVVQLRPCYSYLDSAESKAAREASGAGESSHDEGEEDSRPVTVRYAPHESEDALARRMASYEHYKRQMDEEAWVNVRHCSIDSYESHIGRLNLLAEKKQASTEFYMPPAKYLPRLIPSMEEETSTVASLPSNVLSLAVLKTMPRDERIKALMRSVRAIRFSELLTVLKSLGEQQSTLSLEFIQDVLRHLQHCAVLVQGCWVVKSETLYAKDSVSDQTGVSSSVLRSARDYILYRFHTEERSDDRVVVTRRDVADNVAPMSMEDEREILDKIARRSSLKRGWEFRYDRDVDFLGGEYYRHVSKTQEAYWQKQEIVWQKLQVSKKQTVTSPTSINPPTKAKRSRVRTKSGGIDRSISDQSESESDVSMQTEDHAPAGGAVDDCVIVGATASRTTHHNLAQQGLGAGDVDVNSLLPLLIKSEPGVEPTTSATVEHLIATQPTTSAVAIEQIRVALAEFAAERLKIQTVLSVNSLRTQLDLHRASLPAGHVLSVAVGLASTAQVLDQALVDCGAVRASFNCERGGTDTVYMLAKRGDGSDLIRTCVVDLLRTQKSVTLNSVKKIMQTTNADVEFSDSDLRNILREYCVAAGSCWTLKQTSRTSVDS